MKWFLAFLGVVAICCSALFMRTDVKDNQDYLRIHIIANSNQSEDQIVKYKVKDAVTDLLHGELAQACSASDAKKIVIDRLNLISFQVNNVLAENMCNYSCDVKIKNEILPARSYTNLTLDAGEYETLVITLGNGAGDNWWCVIFPDVCFAN